MSRTRSDAAFNSVSAGSLSVAGVTAAPAPYITTITFATGVSGAVTMAGPTGPGIYAADLVYSIVDANLARTSSYSSGQLVYVDRHSDGTRALLLATANATPSFAGAVFTPSASGTDTAITFTPGANTTSRVDLTATFRRL
jgi:hypothetical protein